jgi:hypothetical protein
LVERARATNRERPVREPAPRARVLAHDAGDARFVLWRRDGARGRGRSGLPASLARRNGALARANAHARARAAARSPSHVLPRHAQRHTDAAVDLVQHARLRARERRRASGA